MRRGVDARVPGCARALARRRVGHADVRVDAGDTRETPDVALIGRGRAWGCARGVCWAEATLLFSKVSKSRVNICGCTFRFLETEMTCAPSKKKSESADRAGTRIVSRASRLMRQVAFSLSKKALPSAFPLKNDGAPTPRRRAGGRLPRLDARVPLRREAPARQGHGRHARDRGARLRGPARGAHRVSRNVGNAESARNAPSVDTRIVREPSGFLRNTRAPGV